RRTMKVKGISFFELHAEKFVLGLAVLLLLAVVAMQFLGGGSTVRVDNREVGVGEVNSILKQRAEALASRLRADAPSGVDLFDGEPPVMIDTFSESIASSISPRSDLPKGQPALASTLVPSDIADVAWYHEPRFAGVAIGEVVQTSDAVTAQGWGSLASLGGRFESEATSFDLTWLTPSVRIDLASLRNELLRNAPRANPPRLPIPGVWHNDALMIVDVVFERQEQLDGGWGPVEAVAAFPTQDSYRPYVATADASLRDDAFEELARAARQLEILQPDFVEVVNGSFVAPIDAPTASAADPQAAAAGEEVSRLRRELQRYRQDEARTKARLDELGGPVRDDEEKPAGRPGGRDRGRDSGSAGGGAAPPGGGGLGSGSGMQGRRGAGDEAQDEATRRRRVALSERLQRIASQIARTEAEIARVAPGLETGGSTVEIPNVNEDASIVAWTHDLDVRPGSVYRYRARVEVYNPFFARTTQLVPEQQSLANGFTISSVASEWSPSVRVSPPVSFFLARAVPGEGGLGLGTASMEVFAFRDGKRRSESFSVQPGDVIGSPATVRRGGKVLAEVDFTTGWFVVDILEDPSRDDVSGGDRAKGAIVLVARVEDPSVIEARYVEVDRSSETRRRFVDEVRTAADAEAG
ncbi:MAG: hypothetical protein ACO3P8_11205, partial [Steroidobacteraceae bacterium]